MGKKTSGSAKYIFVMDCPCDENLYYASAFDKADCMFIGMSIDSTSHDSSKNKSLFYMKCLKTAYKALQCSNEGDVIICKDFNIGAYMLTLCKLCFKKRTVVTIDVMLHHEPDKLPVKMRKYIYRWVLKNPNFHFSVPQKEMLKHYKSTYKIDEQRVFELNGCHKECTTQEFSQGDKFVLCAGVRRDWNTFFRTARLLPAVHFIGIADKKYFDANLLKRTPKNLEMKYDIVEPELSDYVSRCAVVCIPVENDWADKMVLFQAAFMNKPIVCTKTPAFTSVVVDGDREGALLAKKEDCQTMAVHIDDLLKIPWKAEDLTKKMNQIVRHLTPYNFSKQILDYVHPLAAKVG